MTHLLGSCNSSNVPEGNNIEVIWKVLSNNWKDTPGVRAQFTLVNNGESKLSDSNWALYFNQSPRTVVNSGQEYKVKVERISGDWYRIVPLEGFVLDPGDSISIIYESDQWWIKEADAPAGLYFVFLDENGDETISLAESYRIEPFEIEDQYNRHLGDLEPFPSPGNLYNLNRPLSLVPAHQLLPVVPTPSAIVLGIDSVFIDETWTISFDNGLEFEAGYLAETLKELTGLEIKLGTKELTNNKVVHLGLVLNAPGDNVEDYSLSVSSKGIRITGIGNAGVFYGVQSLISLSDAGLTDSSGKNIIVPAVEIADSPRFAYRGVHLDVSRNFQSAEAVKKLIDILGYYKINTLHLHLTDDEGWRLAINALPELTEIGGQRGHTTKDANALHPSYGSGPFTYGEGSFGSGFYTQQEFVDILRYAHERHIRVVPEINLPGHARAAIKSMEARYQRLMDEGSQEEANRYRLIDPDDTSQYSSAQYYTDNVVNVASDGVYNLLETVLDEVEQMYHDAGAPLEMVHIGGDEVPGGAWTESPLAAKVMERNPALGVSANLHAYFTQKALTIFQKHNLKMGGWEEVALMKDVDGTLIPNPTFADGQLIPYVWNNLWGAQDLAYRLANRGYPVVLSHVTAFYFDLAYNKDPREPGLYWAGFVNTHSAWFHNPFNVFQTTTHDNMGRQVDILNEYINMERLSPGAVDNILGVQAQIWTETIRGSQMLEYYLLPKLAGFAESAWAQNRSWQKDDVKEIDKNLEQSEWNVFANTLGQKELPRLAKLFGGFNYRVPPPGALIENGLLLANSEFPGLIIRYTVDGSEPLINSPIYTAPIDVDNSEIKLACFDSAGNRSTIILISN